MSDQSVVLDDVHLTLTSKAGPVNILRGVSLTAERGQSIAVLGPSGAGKSTLLAIIAGLERADRGRVVVSGTEIGGLGESDLAAFRRSAVGIVFQAFHLIPTMTALENVALPLELGTPRRPLRRRRVRRWRASASASACSTTRASSPAASSSGWRSPGPSCLSPTCCSPTSPPANLDGETGDAVMGELFRMRAVGGSTLILVTHDHALAGQCDRMVHIADGRIVAPAEV